MILIFKTAKENIMEFSNSPEENILSIPTHES